MLWHKRVCWSEETCVLRLPNWACFDLFLCSVSFSAMHLCSCTSCAGLQFPHPFLTPNPDPLLPWHPQEARQQMSDFLALVSRFEGSLCFPQGSCGFFFWKCFSFSDDILLSVPWPKLATSGTAFLFGDGLITFLITAEIWAEGAHRIQVYWEGLHFRSAPSCESHLCMSPQLGKLLWLNRHISQSSLYEPLTALPSWTA